jgi:hypothetical protein
MNERIEKRAIKHLEHIEDELEEIKNRTPNKRQTFIYGLFQGGGALLGGIFALTLLGWALSFFGIVPGLSEITKYLQSIVENFRR